MNLQRHFQEIKKVFFPRWDRQDLWRVSSRSRRKVHGHCDPDLKVIEIVIQHSDPDERDKLIVHEICHAVAEMSHGKKWQDRMEKAARKADELGRGRLASLLREEIIGYQQSGSELEHAYNQIRDALNENPDLTFRQIARWLADQYGLLVSEVATSFRRAKKVFQEAKREALEEREMKRALIESSQESSECGK
jgi:uncharacterized membrane-anchored protein YjiN (DUF445 family)